MTCQYQGLSIGYAKKLQLIKELKYFTHIVFLFYFIIFFKLNIKKYGEMLQCYLTIFTL